MIHKIPPKTSSPADLVAYVLNPAKGSMIGGTFARDARVGEIVEEFQALGALNRRVERLVTHVSLRLAPGETLSDRSWRAVAARYLHEMGYSDNPYLIALHKEPGSEHIHIVVGRIRADGSCVADSFERLRGQPLMREFEQRYGLVAVPSSRDSLRTAPDRGEIARALREETPNLRLELQDLVEQAARRANGVFSAFVTGLERDGVSVRLHLGPTGQPRGISYEVDGVAFQGKNLGRGFTLGSLNRHGLVLDNKTDQPLIDRIGVASQTRTEATRAPKESPRQAARRHLLESLEREVSGTVTLEELEARLQANDVRFRLHWSPQGPPIGISYEYAGHHFTGRNVPGDFSLGALVRRGLDLSVTPPDGARWGPPGDGPEPAIPLRSRESAAAELRLRINHAASQAADLDSFLRLARLNGFEARLHLGAEGQPVGISFQLDGQKFSGGKLGGSFSLGGLRKTHDWAVPAQEDHQIVAITAELHSAARAAKGSFAAFVEAVEDTGVEIRAYVDQETRAVRGLSYRVKGESFSASRLGPELGSRGLETYFDIKPRTQEDHAALKRIAKETTSTKAPFVADEILHRELAAKILAAAEGASGAADFSARLKEQGIALRLYLDPQGEVAKAAYLYDEKFYTPRALGSDTDIPSLAATHGLTFDPRRDSALLGAIGVEVSPSAVIDKVALIPQLADQIANKAFDSPTFGQLVQRLAQDEIKIHLYTDQNDEVRGTSYEIRGVFISARALGPEFTFSGLARDLGVRIDPGDPAIAELSTRLPESPPNPRDLFEEIQDRIALAASRSPDLATFSAHLLSSEVHVRINLDENGAPLTLSYRAAGRDFDARGLGPQFTLGGLRRAFGLDTSAQANSDYIRQHGIPPTEWQAQLARSLETINSARQRGAEERRQAAAALRQGGPLEAMRHFANAQYLLHAATHPKALVVAAARQFPGARPLQAAVSLFGAVRSPSAAVSWALSIASRSIAQRAHDLRPSIPSARSLAAELASAYGQAALRDARTVEVFSGRLRMLGIEMQVVPGPQPALFYQIGEQMIPAAELSRGLDLRGLQQRFGDRNDQGFLAALDPTTAPHLRGERSSGFTDRGIVSPRGVPPDRSDSDLGSPTGRRIESDQPAAASGPSPDAPGHPSAVGDASAPADLSAPAIESYPDLPYSGAELSPANRPDRATTDSPSYPSIGTQNGARGTSGESVFGASSAATDPAHAPDLSTREREFALERHLAALGSERQDFRADLRVSLDDKPLISKVGLTSDDLASLKGDLLAYGSAGARVEIRVEGLQVLRDVSGQAVEQAILRGFDPAAVIETSPQRFDVWLRHDPSSAADARRYLERIYRLEYGLPHVGASSGYGQVAGASSTLESARLVSHSGASPSQAGELSQFLSSHANAVREQTARSLVAAGLPSLPQFYRDNPKLSPREADIQWAELAVRQGLPRPEIATAIALSGSRSNSKDPRRPLRYSAQVVKTALENALHLSPAAAQAAALQSLATATALPVQILRVVIGLARFAAKLALRL